MKVMKHLKISIFLLFLFLLTACAPSAILAQEAPVSTEIVPLMSVTEDIPIVVEATLTAEVEATPSPRPTLTADSWTQMPIVPIVSERTREIYQRGLEMGNNPNAFSKVGDCQNVNSLFLGVFEKPDDFVLGEEYAYLQETIDYFYGSFSRESLAVYKGFNVASVLSPLRSDKSVCEPTESPLACELRVNQPSFAIISLEQWWEKPAGDYEAYMRQIVEYTISQGVVPILATKADNIEGDNSINQTIAQIAYEYDIPLWNFWRASYVLPDNGLIREGDDNFHLTYARNYFDDPLRMENAWPWRNLTALQSLDAVWRGVTE